MSLKTCGDWPLKVEMDRLFIMAPVSIKDARIILRPSLHIDRLKRKKDKGEQSGCWSQD